MLITLIIINQPGKLIAVVFNYFSQIFEKPERDIFNERIKQPIFLKVNYWTILPNLDRFHDIIKSK